jgi:hypothetical protein
MKTTTIIEVFFVIFMSAALLVVKKPNFKNNYLSLKLIIEVFLVEHN